MIAKLEKEHQPQITSSAKVYGEFSKIIVPKIEPSNKLPIGALRSRSQINKNKNKNKSKKGIITMHCLAGYPNTICVSTCYWDMLSYFHFSARDVHSHKKWALKDLMMASYM